MIVFGCFVISFGANVHGAMIVFRFIVGFNFILPVLKIIQSKVAGI
jgi:hypothetical protein